MWCVLCVLLEVCGRTVCRLSCKKTGERGSQGQGQAIESSPVFLYFDLCSQSQFACPLRVINYAAFLRVRRILVPGDGVKQSRAGNKLPTFLSDG